MGNASTAALPYEIGPQTHPPTRAGSGGFAIHGGRRKSDDTPVTVFRASKAAMTSADGQFYPALHHFQKIKTLIHPHILRAFATLDTDSPNGPPPANTDLRATTGDWIVVTEQVTPLHDFLLQNNNDNTHLSEKITWGLHNLIASLTFLHTTPKPPLAHGNLSPYSIFVTPAGDFKLSSFHLLTPIVEDDDGIGTTPHFRRYERHVTPDEYRSPERREERWDEIGKSGAVHAMDAYSLGILIRELYGDVPLSLKKAVQRLQTADMRLRPRVGSLAKCPIFDRSPLVRAQLFLNEISTKGVEEKTVFFTSLVDLMNRHVLDRSVAIHKVFPILVNSVETTTSGTGGVGQEIHRRELLSVLPPLFYIAEHYFSATEDSTSNGDHANDKKGEFKTKMKPLVEALFTVNDRGVRGHLLSRISLFASHFDPSTLNSSVFEPMCSGFTDSSAPLRELTLKSTIVLVPYLTPVHLEKLMRYLIRMQGDVEASIRTNTVIFIGKVAPKLSDSLRDKLILPAFMRAMKDVFTPCRLAALKAVLACREYFDEKNVAEKVLPAVVPHLMDGVGEVREEAFRVVDALLVVLRAKNEKLCLEEKEEQERHVSRDGAVSASSLTGSAALGGHVSGGTLVAPASTSNNSAGYLTGWGSWATSKITNTAKAEEVIGGGGGAENAASSPVANNSYRKAEVTPTLAISSLALADTIRGVDDGGGGEEGWSDDEVVNDKMDDVDAFDLMRPTNPGLSVPSWAMKDTKEDDDFFSIFDKKPVVATLSGKSALGKSGRTSSLMVPSKKNPSLSERKSELASKRAEKQPQKGAVTKLSISAKGAGKGGDLTDGWDDF